MVVAGSCLCGAVRFTVNAVSGPMEICHCQRCRKLSGSNALVMLAVNVNRFRWECGKDTIRRYTAPVLNQPPPYATHFCATCGSPVPDPDPVGEMLEIPAGLLDTDPGLRPDKHIFVEFVPAWDHIADEIPQFSIRDLARLRTGRELPAGAELLTHQGKRYKV